MERVDSEQKPVFALVAVACCLIVVGSTADARLDWMNYLCYGSALVLLGAGVASAVRK